MRPLGSHNDNERAASMEKLLEDGINAIGLGPQGMGGKYSVMGVNIENTARHPSTIGVATSVETAALLSKKALMRPIGSHNENERAAKMETLLEDGINKIGLGPQGMGGKYSVMGVNIENTARHPSTIGVAVNVGCWSHRRGHIIFDKDLNYTITTHTGVEL